jgi:hypothetical protein
MYGIAGLLNLDSFYDTPDPYAIYIEYVLCKSSLESNPWKVVFILQAVKLSLTCQNDYEGICLFLSLLFLFHSFDAGTVCSSGMQPPMTKLFLWENSLPVSNQLSCGIQDPLW